MNRSDEARVKAAKDLRQHVKISIRLGLNNFLRKMMRRTHEDTCRIMKKSLDYDYQRIFESLLELNSLTFSFLFFSFLFFSFLFFSFLFFLEGFDSVS